MAFSNTTATIERKYVVIMNHLVEPTIKAHRSQQGIDTEAPIVWIEVRWSPSHAQPVAKKEVASNASAVDTSWEQLSGWIKPGVAATDGDAVVTIISIEADTKMVTVQDEHGAETLISLESLTTNFGPAEL